MIRFFEHNAWVTIVKETLKSNKYATIIIKLKIVLMSVCMYNEASLTSLRFFASCYSIKLKPFPPLFTRHYKFIAFCGNIFFVKLSAGYF